MDDKPSAIGHLVNQQIAPLPPSKKPEYQLEAARNKRYAALVAKRIEKRDARLKKYRPR